MRLPPVERYVRTSVEIAHGSLEVGVQYFDGEDVDHMRGCIHEWARMTSAWKGAIAGTLTAADADRMTRWLDERLVSAYGDERGRFIEVWNATEALTQVYAPCGMPRVR